MDENLLRTGQIIQALAFAAHKHRDQRRKDHKASPYINHPIALANVLVNEAGITDPVTICAALLHDTIEDTETTADELLEAFGPDVLGVVLEVTDDKSLTKADRKRLQVEHAAGKSDRAKMVKLADKTCNLRDIISSPPADWTDQRKQEYFDWAKTVVDQLRGVNSKLEELFDTAYRSKPRDNAMNGKQALRMPELFDVEGIPVSLGNIAEGVPSCAAWDTFPPRVFNPDSAWRNGAPVSVDEFMALLTSDTRRYFAKSMAPITSL